jgi:hypothetical protein
MPLRTGQNRVEVRYLGAQLLQAVHEWLYLHDHAWSAAKGIVIGRPMQVSGVLPEIMQVNPHQTLLLGTFQDTLLQR